MTVPCRLSGAFVPTSQYCSCLDACQGHSHLIASSVSMQFLHLQISPFDKSSIPMLTHLHMEITSLPLPNCILTPLQLYYQDKHGQEQETTLDIPEWFSGNHNTLLVLHNDAGNIYSSGFATSCQGHSSPCAPRPM